MRMFSYLIVLGCSLAAVPATAQIGGNTNIPPIRSIDRTCLPAGAPRADLPLYSGDLNEKYQEVAYLDSFISTDKCEDTTRNQLKDLQAKGQTIGADALIRVRMLSNEVTGWNENPETPFWSVKQGTTNDYFFRATAIKYLVWPKAEPRTMAVKRAPAPVKTSTAPLVDTGNLQKLKIDRNDRHEKTVPEVYATQQSLGRP